MNSTGCLIIHGFAGSTEEIKPVSDYLGSQGFVTICPVLKGHMGTRKELGSFGYGDWIDSAERALLELKARCGNVYIIGFSMGGLIGVNLALKYDIKGLITLSMPIYYRDIEKIALNIFSDIRSGNHEHIKYYIKSSIDKPLLALINFRLLLYKTKPLINRLTCPMFIAHGLLDDTAHYKSAEYVYKNTYSTIKSRKLYKNASHVICHSMDRDELLADLHEFLLKTYL